MFHAYKAPDGWAYQVFNPNILETILHSMALSLKDLIAGNITKSLIVNHILPVTSIIILAIGSLWGIFIKKGAGIPLGVFGILATVMFTLNSNLVSVHRYVLACIPLFIIYSLFIQKHPHLTWINYLIIPGMFVLQLALYILFVTGNFAG